MVSDDVRLCARRIERAWRSGRPLSLDDCRLLSRILETCALDAAALEGVPLVLDQVRPAPDAAWPVVCTRGAAPPPPPGATARILPFRRPPDG